MAQTEVVLEQSSDVSLQGKITRCRVPTAITEQAGGVDGDAINWQVLKNGNDIWITGVVVKGAKKGRVAPTKTPAAKAVAPAKAAVKKVAAKKSGGAKPVAVTPPRAKAVGLDEALGGEENWADDAPPKSGVSKPTVPAIKKGAGGGRYTVPGRAK